jgi:hypothetical protein
MNPQSPFPAVRVAAVIFVMAVALLSAACSSSPSTTASGASPGTGASASAGGGTNYASELAFARCVRSHGVPNFPDPDSTGHFSKTVLRALGVSDSRLRAAEGPCQNLLPAGPPPLTAAQQQDYLRAAQCMRSHGITIFPDPVFSAGTVHFPEPPAGFNTSSPQFIQAEQVCKRLIPAGLPYSGSGS